MTTETHRAPHDCPVCGDRLSITRLGCGTCGSEIGGVFATCEFCALGADEMETLKVFLASRGNLREVEKHLGVSYPTARLRLTQLLMKLGLSGESGEAVDVGGDEPADEGVAASAGSPEPTPSRDDILAAVASGSMSPAEAQRLLTQL